MFSIGYFRSWSPQCRSPKGLNKITAGTVTHSLRLCRLSRLPFATSRRTWGVFGRMLAQVGASSQVGPEASVATGF